MTKRKLTTEVEGRSIQDWDNDWVHVEGGFTRYHPQYRHEVGLYRAVLHGEVTAIGAGVSRDGGLAKRLSDFRRPGNHERDHNLGREIYAHLDVADLEVLITGSDWVARDIAVRLTRPMIVMHKPRWNVDDAILIHHG